MCTVIKINVGKKTGRRSKTWWLDAIENDMWTVMDARMIWEFGPCGGLRRG